MKYLVLIILVVLMVPGFVFAQEQFKWQTNIKYTVTYLIDEDTHKVIEDVYYRGIFYGDPTQSRPVFTQEGIIDRYDHNVFVELLKVYKNGKKESFLVLTKNIVEIKKILTKGFDAGKASVDESEDTKSEDNKLQMSIK